MAAIDENGHSTSIKPGSACKIRYQLLQTRYLGGLVLLLVMPFTIAGEPTVFSTGAGMEHRRGQALSKLQPEGQAMLEQGFTG
jgi:hypothetical protein